MTERPALEVDLVWTGDLVFDGSAGPARLTLDGDQRVGPSPMQALAAALAGCMAIDVVTILRKGRHDLRGLHAHLTARRAEEPPRRVVAVDLRFTIEGPVPPEAVARALALSREKYCSVWHSLRPDIAFDVAAEIATARP